MLILNKDNQDILDEMNKEARARARAKARAWNAASCAHIDAEIASGSSEWVCLDESEGKWEGV